MVGSEDTTIPSQSISKRLDVSIFLNPRVAESPAQSKKWSFKLRNLIGCRTRPAQYWRPWDSHSPSATTATLLLEPIVGICWSGASRLMQGSETIQRKRQEMFYAQFLGSILVQSWPEWHLNAGWECTNGSWEYQHRSCTSACLGAEMKKISKLL